MGVAVSGGFPVWLGGDPSLYADASDYFLICSLALLPITMARLGTGMLQCSGDMRTPSLLNVLSCALNVCLLERALMSSAYIAVTATVAPLGVVSVAAHSLAITVEAICYMPGLGMEAAATTLVGQAVGAHRRDVARSFARLSTALGMIVMTLSGMLMFVFAPQVLAMLTPDEAVRSLGTTILRIEAFAEPLYAASMVAAGALRGAGDTLVPSVFTLLSNWGVRIPALAVCGSALWAGGLLDGHGARALPTWHALFGASVARPLARQVPRVSAAASAGLVHLSS